MKNLGKFKFLLAFTFLLLFSAIIAGCSSSDCNRSFTHVPAGVKATITGRVINPLLADAPIGGAQIGISGAKATSNVTAADGTFSVDVTADPGSIVTLSFTKEKYTIDDLAVTVNSDGTVTALSV